MTSTEVQRTQIRGITFSWDLSPVVGEHAGDFDMEALHSEYQDAIRADIVAAAPSAVVAFDGYGWASLIIECDVDEVDAVHAIDWDGERDERPGSSWDLNAALARHDITPEP